jgi:hypothetical protein
MPDHEPILGALFVIALPEVSPQFFVGLELLTKHIVFFLDVSKE